MEISSTVEKKSWFNRHLNWTFVFTIIAFYFFNLIIGAITGIVLVINDPFISQAEIDAFADKVSLPIAFGLIAILILPVSGWILKQKHRSLWWLLILFVPLGLIVFLCLDNCSSKHLGEIGESQNTLTANSQDS